IPPCVGLFVFSTSILPQVGACCLFFTTFEAGVNFSLSLLFCAKTLSYTPFSGVNLFSPFR
ncbi:MAG: hypothetical protein ACOY3H_07650, partial [Bacillota bacterium]